jgi:hypothetical protein
MISIRIHRHLKYIVIFAIGFLVGGYLHSANAQTIVDYSRSPSGSGSYSDMTVTLTMDQDMFNLCTINPADTSRVDIYAIDQESESWEIVQIGSSDEFAPTLIPQNYPINFWQDGQAIAVLFQCNYGLGSELLLEGSYDEDSPVLFTYSSTPAPVTPIRIGSFLGGKATTTPVQLMATVVTGVQDTGGDLWPMFVFLGVALAFMIGLQLTVFTKRASTGLGMAQDGLKQSKPTKVRRFPRTGDYRAFKRGKKLNKADGIDLFND